MRKGYFVHYMQTRRPRKRRERPVVEAETPKPEPIEPPAPVRTGLIVRPDTRLLVRGPIEIIKVAR